jgi:uncharacterized protein (TIGR03437 family)
VKWSSSTPEVATINASGLATGVGRGTTTITATSGSISGSATLTVGVSTTIVSAASFLPTAVAPGQIITIFGSGVGPPIPAGLRLTAAGLVDTLLSDTRVLFDGTPAPLLYVSSTQISAVVPYGIAIGSSTRLQTEYQGITSGGLDLQVVDAAPAIFTLDSSGIGPGAILNQDSTVNSIANPADRNSVVTIYGTGEGQTNPVGVDGLITASTLRTPVQPVSVTIGGQPAEVLYGGAAPGLIAGVLQVNARVPAGVAPGSQVPVIVTVGNKLSQSGVTLAVR